MKLKYTDNLIEAGCDEVGVGCLAGPIIAAAVIFPNNFDINQEGASAIRDSKTLSYKQRERLSSYIIKKSAYWAIGYASNEEVDDINCKNASFLAMHRAIDNLPCKPELLLIDGHIFKPHNFLSYVCIIKGDAKFLSIAAASILAKVCRDSFMHAMHHFYPNYSWDTNMGYPTPFHKNAIHNFGLTDLHRKSFAISKLYL